MSKETKQSLRLFGILSIVLIVSFLAGLCFGAVKLSPADLIRAILEKAPESTEARIFYYVRLPRTLAAMLSGMALSVSGVIIQGVLHNPMAGPNIIGVNAGAGFAGLLTLTLLPAGQNLTPAAAFLGALAACFLIYGIAAKTGAGKVTLVLAGVALNSILSAGIDLLRTLYPERAADATAFFIGGFSGVNLQSLVPAWYYIAAGLLAACFLAGSLDLLSLGEASAQSLGMNVPLARFFLLSCASVLAGAAVSFSGLLGFVGLIVPHIVRKLTGGSHRRLLPAAALAGGSFVILCDLLSRLIFAPYEIPVGIVMSLLGGPFFLWLILSGKTRGGSL